jgi:hypothetical protein
MSEEGSGEMQGGRPDRRFLENLYRDFSRFLENLYRDFSRFLEISRESVSADAFLPRIGRGARAG